MVELQLDGLDVAALVASALGIDPDVESFDLGHPVVRVIIQPLLDAADPLHSARRLLREPDGVPHDLLMLEGFGDHLTPPPAIEALASAAGLPIAEPVGRSIPGLDLQAIGSVPLPASQNLPAVDGVQPTGALIQVPEGGHYLIYLDEDIRTRVFDFMDSALNGQAQIDP